MNNNRKSLEILIQNLETQIHQMQQTAAGVEADARIEYNRRIDDLKDQKREAEQKLAELEASGTSTVEDIKSGIQQAWNDVKETVSDAVARLK